MKRKKDLSARIRDLRKEDLNELMESAMGLMQLKHLRATPLPPKSDARYEELKQLKGEKEKEIIINLPRSAKIILERNGIKTINHMPIK